MVEPAAAQPGPLRAELALWLGIATTVAMYTVGKFWLEDLSFGGRYALLFAWIFGMMLWLSFGVVRHADCLAVKLGEPYGTLILTISVISIEVVMIAAVMLTGAENPTLARDTMFAVLMIVLNGMLGVTLISGAWRHGLQEYNVAGANAYLAVIVPLAGATLVLPRFTESAPGGAFSTPQAIFAIAASILLWGVFLAIQTVRHRGHFTAPAGLANEDEDEDGHGHGAHPTRSVAYHATFLVLTMLPVVLLSKKMAVLIDYGIAGLGAPAALGGFLVATMVLLPEALGALRAARANQLQRTVNICLGSGLATIGLTVPAVLTIGLVTGRDVELGLDAADIVMLALTLLVSMLTFGSGRTSVLHGVVHVILFVGYVILLFD